jgi:hypothetical protein
MRLGQSPAVFETDAENGETPREVLSKRSKSSTTYNTQCNVDGALAFAGGGDINKRLRPIRWFRLIPPLLFVDLMSVFGANEAILARLRADAALVEALRTLLKSPGLVSLERKKLSITVPNKRADASHGALTSALRTVGQRLETLIGGYLNDEIGFTRLTRPYRWLVWIPGIVFPLCGYLLVSSLKPYKIGEDALALSLAACVAISLLAVFGSLRKHALGGAAIHMALPTTIISSLFLGPSIAMIGNTLVGEQILTPQRFHVSGTIVRSHGRTPSCRLRLDDPSTTIAPGMTVYSLPLTLLGQPLCYDEGVSRTYDVDVNPGLLGSPFVQSIRISDPTAAH